MADLKISQLNSLAGSSLANNDVLAVVDTSASETKKITSKDLVQYGYALVDPNTLDGNVIEPGTTSARGTVQLTDSTSSTSTTTAATPNAVKGAFDLANAALPKSGGTMTGQILGDDSTSASTPGYAFDGDPDTGLLRTGANELGLVTGGTARLTIDASGNVIVPGNFTVQGTTTTIDTTTLVVEDKNIEMGAVATPSDVTADGGGITLRGTTDKTINWIDATDAWTSSERFSVPAGTAGAPSLTFTGDPNTGIYSPGADQVAISTNGTAKLTVGAVQSVLTHNLRLDTTNANAALLVRSNVANGGAGFSEVYLGNTSTDTRGYISYGHAADSLAFGTSGAERLRITSAGLVGLGTSAPAGRLHIAGYTSTDQSPDLQISRPSSGTAIQTGPNITFADGTTNNTTTLQVTQGRFGVWNYGSSSWNERLCITPGGLVGIGTSAPPSLCSIAGPAVTGTVGRLLQVYASSAAGVGSGSEIWLGWNPSNLNAGGGATIGGIYNGTGADLVFSTPTNSSSAPTERVRIDSSGRLLIGTSSAPSALSPSIQSARPGGAYFVAANTFSVSSSGDILGEVHFLGNQSGGYVHGATISATADATWSSSSDGPTRLVFSVTRDGQASPTPAVRINNTGQNAIYASATSLISSSATGSGSTEYVFVGQHSATTFANGTDCIRITTNGNVTNLNNSYGQISDQKLKENVVAANSQWSDVKAIQVKNFNFIGSTDRQIGVIAQEVEAVSPGLVDQSPDRDEDGNDLGTVTKSVKYSVLYMKAVKALQEAMERIETLEAKVAALESA